MIFWTFVLTLGLSRAGLKNLSLGCADTCLDTHTRHGLPRYAWTSMGLS